MNEHLYVIGYDISDPKRWRRVFNTMKGYGEWLQLSVFQCRLRRDRMAELTALLNDLIHHGEDHIVILDLGPANTVNPRIKSLGKPFEVIRKEAVIV